MHTAINNRSSKAFRRTHENPRAKTRVQLPRSLKASPHRDVTCNLKSLRRELREAEAYWTRQYRWVAEVKLMSPEQITRAWQTAEDWQLRSLAIQALEVDPTLRLELALYREGGGKGADGEYHAPSATLTQVLAAMVTKHPVRHPCVVSRDILNAQNGRAV